jgi:hypothetical protein
MVGTITFDSALAQAKRQGYPLSILLGNGFSRAFSDEFAYSRLRDVADMHDLTVTKDELFDHAASNDFETVIQHLQQSARLTEIYEPANIHLRQRLLDDADVVKRGLVEALTKIHPASGQMIHDDKYRSARQFLSHFSKIFSLNYDVLLYWTVLQDKLAPRKVVLKDGFGRRTDDGPLAWSEPIRIDQQEIFYLHGAMHFYVGDDGQLCKLEYSDGRIVEQLQSNLAAGKYPLVVTEGSSRDKEARIARSRYLTYCHTRLSRMRGALFIHGMAMSESDRHVLTEIAKGPGAIDAFYVGLHGAQCEATDIIAAKATALARTHAEKSGRTVGVKFYRSETASVWG